MSVPKPQGHAPQPAGQHVPGVPHGAGQVQGCEDLPEQAAAQQKQRHSQKPPQGRAARQGQQGIQDTQHHRPRQEVRAVPCQQAVQRPGGGRDEAKTVQDVQSGDDGRGRDVPFHLRTPTAGAAPG